MTPTARRPSPRAPLPRVLSALATLLLFASAAQVSFATSATSSFVAREGGRFVLDGATFHVAGANCYYLAYSSGADAGSYEHDWVKEVLDEAQSLELNVLRVWSFQDEWWQRDRALQPAPGQYNERFLVALDGLIVESARRDIRLLLCLTNYWEDYGGAIAYVNWAHAAGERRADGHSLDRQEDFFTSQLCRAWFKRFATHVLSRVNTITGVAYRDDPAIFAWELINEPRVLGDASGDILQNWIDEMSAHAKSVDANHMLTVGIEGFWGKTSPHRVGENPIDGAERMGCDFVRNFLNPNLDFASVHVWPDLWLYCDDDCKFEFMKTWIAGHLEESRDTFDKPVLLEEFGKYRPLDSRDRFFREAFRMSLPPSTPVPSHAGGVLFWHMDPSGYPHETDGFSVQLPRDIGTGEIIKGASASVRELRRNANVAGGGGRERHATFPERPRADPEAYRAAPVADSTDKSASASASANANANANARPTPPEAAGYRFPSFRRPVQTYAATETVERRGDDEGDAVGPAGAPPGPTRMNDESPCKPPPPPP